MIFDAAGFSFCRMFEDNWRDIRREYENLGRHVLDVHRNSAHADYLALAKKRNGWMPSWQVGSDRPNADWLTYGLCYGKTFPDEAFFKYPVTGGLLKRMGDSVIVAAFSLMHGPSFIAPHTHPELGANLLTYHLGIVTPGLCYLNVAGKFVQEQERKSVVFDGSCVHFALNMSNSERVLLYMEFDRSKLA
jgi:aspartyl/asparaginyl beta-hydroxylase (cupin superfamily)